jgi:hypothetical protein
VRRLSDADEAFLQQTLNKARAYRALMVAEAGVAYPPIAVVASDAIPTAATWKAPAAEGAPYSFDLLSDALTVPGDGRFAHDLAGPPKGVPVVVRLTSKASHTGVAVDLPLIEQAIKALLAARE